MNKKVITVIRGDGIGPSIVDAAIRVLDHIDCGLTYEFVDAGQRALSLTGELLPPATVESIERTGVVLKGPLETPIRGGFASVNVLLRQKFQLFANVRPVVSFVGTKAKFEHIDIVTVRENTEGLYCGKGQLVSEDGKSAQSLSIVTEEGSQRLLRFAFDVARREERQSVTVVHKANILKSTSGLFLQTARNVAKEYPEIIMKEMIVDNACMQLVLDPHQFEVIATTNLFGDIISDLCAGLIGGLGMAPGANIGENCALFEAVHGTAPDLTGRNIANPCSIILAACLMLEHIGLPDPAQRIRRAIRLLIALGESTTGDLGGKASTTEFTDALLARLPSID